MPIVLLFTILSLLANVLAIRGYFRERSKADEERRLKAQTHEMLSAYQRFYEIVKRRIEFDQELEELEIFGHGVRPMRDKAEALDPYAYHLVIENHVGLHHVTEKLPDCFLGHCLPFYHGAPNAGEYFPKESFIPIDITDFARARDTIRFHLLNNEYKDRLPYILEARRRVLHEQNLFAIISNQIANQEESITTYTTGGAIRNRSTMRLKNPAAGGRRKPATARSR